jgi:hypothetical protein
MQLVINAPGLKVKEWQAVGPKFQMVKISKFLGGQLLRIWVPINQMVTVYSKHLKTGLVWYSDHEKVS